MAEGVARGILELTAECLAKLGLVLSGIAGLAILSVILFMIVDTVFDIVRERSR